MRAWVVAFCVRLSACEAGAPLGTSCGSTSQCSVPLVCRLARCRAECRLNRDCPIGARCLLDQAGLGACSLDRDDRCESGGDACPTGLLCLTNQCVNTCTDMLGCPGDGECREVAAVGVSFCFASDRRDGGTLPVDAGRDGGAGSGQDSGVDAGRGDAGATDAAGDAGVRARDAADQPTLNSARFASIDSRT